MGPTFRLLRLGGIPVDAHWTWPVAFAVVAWTLAASVFPADFPEVGGAGHVVMAVAAAGLLFLSVVLHELAHAVVARRAGMPVCGVTLWLLGGVSDTGHRARSPGQELAVAGSGPLVSLALAGGLALAAGRAEGAVGGVLDYVARLNLVVAAFNLVPALPLDGGRILRAWLWRRGGDRLAATRSSGRAGQAFGMTLVVVGLLDLWAGSRLLGVWLVVLGAFLVRAATAEVADALTRHRLHGLTAADVMSSDPGVVLDDTPVARLVEHPPAPVRSGYPVLGGGRLLGVVVLDHARRVPSAERGDRRVEEVMTPLDDIPMVDAADAVLDMVDRFDGTNPTGQVVVIEDGRVVGILDEDDVAGALDRATAGAATPDPPGAAGRRAQVVVAALCLLTVGVLYRPPLVVVSPGPAVDVASDVSVDGVPVTPVTGRFLVPTVEARRTNALGALVALVRDGHRVVSAGEADEVGGGHHPGQARETRILAAAAAALSQGLPATVTGTGAVVVAVGPGTPAAGALRPGDVVLAVDGRPVSQAALVAEIVRASPPSTALVLSVERGGPVIDIVVTTAEGGIGMTLETRDLSVELPFEVTFSGRASGGPGAGLAYALAIADLLSAHDVARGRTVAAVGAIDADGHLGPAGDPAATAAAAAAAGASVLLVPSDEADDARHDGLTVEGVESLARALEVLSTTV